MSDQPVVPKPAPPRSGVQRAERMRILDRYARVGRNGKPQTCGPANGVRKVIFATEADAVAAEAELRAAGSKVQESYPCPRSQHGHFHLTSDIEQAERRRDG